MRTSFFFFCIAIIISLPLSTTNAQTINFEETWKEFLENNKISNTSVLVRPNKAYNPPAYAKYLLMNTNSRLCQSDVETAENLMVELQEMNPGVHKSIQGFVEKMEEVDSKIETFHSMDALWDRFLQTKEITLEELDAIEGAKTMCEKRTLAKYSFMMAYSHFCRGHIDKAQDVFENRTLRLIEKTTFNIQEVPGLAPEVASMKSMFKDMAELEVVWKRFVNTGESQGFDIELPLFLCNPIPNMKAYVLNGMADLCKDGPLMIEEIEALQAKSGVAPRGEVKQKIEELRASIGGNDNNLVMLNEAWEAFIPDNVVRHWGKYGYEYCDKEALIRAYIMDGFADVCGLAEEMINEINRVQSSEIIDLDEITMIKINELIAKSQEHRVNGDFIERLWNRFVAQGDTLYEVYEPAEFYCDNIHKVKDWTIQGLSQANDEGQPFLDKIDRFQETFEFNFTEEVECRVQKLRFRLWDFRYQNIVKLAHLEAESPDSYEAKLDELMVEYGMSDRPEVCLDE